MTEHLLDARGLRCPWPALRLARIMRQSGDGARVTMIVDDPKAEAELLSLADVNGWSLGKAVHHGNSVFTINR